MKLLFDQNLSPRLVVSLKIIYPDSSHVQTVGLDRAADEKVWEYASKNDFIVVTKDVDFFERGLLKGYPPKVVLIRRGNCSTFEIENMLRVHADDVEALSANKNIACLVLS